jgi:hypothetical protein
MAIHPIIDPAAVEGDAPGGLGSGVRGKNPIGAAEGVLGGTDPVLFQPVGAYGMSNNQGVVGSSKGSTGAGVFGSASQNGSNFDPATGGTGVLGTGYVGVRGETTTGVAVLGRLFGPNGLAGKFEGDVQVTGSLTVARDIQVTGDLFLAATGKDLAEQFDVEANAHREPGTLMVIGERGALVPCAAAYDRRAIGVVSGARTLKPAITLGQASDADSTISIALVGTVFCRADADKAPIEIGDLLTSSDVPGHAMKALDAVRSFGAVIGKALAPLRNGRDLIPIIVALQ